MRILLKQEYSHTATSQKLLTVQTAALQVEQNLHRHFLQSICLQPAVCEHHIKSAHDITAIVLQLGSRFPQTLIVIPWKLLPYCVNSCKKVNKIENIK